MATTKQNSSKKTSSKKSNSNSKTSKKPVSQKPTSKASASKISKEDQIAADALKLVDEAAALLRSGIRQGAKTSVETRSSVAKKAHELLTKATGGLSAVLSETSSALHKVVKKIEP